MLISDYVVDQLTLLQLFKLYCHANLDLIAFLKLRSIHEPAVVTSAVAFIYTFVQRDGASATSIAPLLSVTWQFTLHALAIRK